MLECVLYFLTIPFAYVCLINTFYDHQQPRDYPPNVRRRFLSATLVTVFAISTTFFLLQSFHQIPNPLNQMGFRASISSLLAAIVFPTFLTSIFYTGTLATLSMEGTLSRSLSLNSLKKDFKDILWIRTAIMAPITEELCFRSCSASLLKHCVGELAATFIAPISFSLSHIHHILEDLRTGKSLIEALTQRTFQMLYTFLFGIYATHIFFQTGHIIAPILSHSLCNLLEIPTIGEFPFNLPESRGLHFLILTLHFGGFIGWLFLCPYLLCAHLYK